jgi:hypothetical protein
MKPTAASPLSRHKNAIGARSASPSMPSSSAHRRSHCRMRRACVSEILAGSGRKKERLSHMTHASTTSAGGLSRTAVHEEIKRGLLLVLQGMQPARLGQRRRPGLAAVSSSYTLAEWRAVAECERCPECDRGRSYRLVLDLCLQRTTLLAMLVGMPKCFAIMPFDAKFTPVLETIERAVNDLGIADLGFDRADRSHRSGLALRNIEESIRDADAIVVDITGDNANVFYELGLAHALRGHEKIVLISQERLAFPFDVSSLQVHTYTPDKLDTLHQKLKTCIDEALAEGGGRLMETIVGRHVRAKRLTRDLEALLQRPRREAVPVIRQEASVSALGMGEDDLRISFPGQADVIRAILGERSKLVEVLEKNVATYRAIIAPRRHPTTNGGDLLKRRLNTLQRFLETSPAAANVDIAVLEPGTIRSTFLVGDRVLYDGVKTDPNGSYDLSIRLADATLVRARAEAFDTLFCEAIARSGPPRDNDDRHDRLFRTLAQVRESQGIPPFRS